MTTKQTEWFVPGGLLLLSLVPAVAGVARLAQLAGGVTRTPENARFFAAPWPVAIHIPAVIVFSLLGAFQFSPGLRRTPRGWHRAVGKLLILCGTLAALSGLWMTLTYPAPPGDRQLVYLERLVAGAAMLLAIGCGVHAIRRRDFVAHGEWMLRAYAIGLGAGTQVLTHLPWFLVVGTTPGELPRGVMMGAGWVINVAVAEWIIRNRSVHEWSALALRREGGWRDGLAPLPVERPTRTTSRQR